MRKFIGLVMSFVVLMYGCNSKPEPEAETMNESATVTLTWKDYDGISEQDPDKATYILNGAIIGQGSKGFTTVIKRLREIPEGSELLIFPDNTLLDAQGSECIGVTPDPVPFRGIPKLYQKLKSVAIEQNIEVWYFAAPPGEVIFDDGEELRIKENWEK